LPGTHPKKNPYDVGDGGGGSMNGGKFGTWGGTDKGSLRSNASAPPQYQQNQYLDNNNLGVPTTVNEPMPALTSIKHADGDEGAVNTRRISGSMSSIERVDAAQYQQPAGGYGGGAIYGQAAPYGGDPNVHHYQPQHTVNAAGEIDPWNHGHHPR
ncbi:hypothetical protein HK102_003858, partial [Quaeritorhiza haematococci]